MLNEQDRAKLDGIVQQMAANKEPDASIQMVVDDFKQKYSRTQVPTPVSIPTPETGIVKDTVQDVAKYFLGMASQVRDVATGVSDLATGVKKAIKGEPVVIPQRPNQTEYDYGYLGKVKSFGKATFDAEGAKALERAAGAGAGIASNIVAGGPVKSVGKSILARTLPKVLQLAKEGAMAGGMYGAGNAAQDGGSATDILSQGGIGAVTGGVATPIVGTAIPAVVKPLTRTFDKLTKPLQTHMSDVAQNINRALSTQGKKSIGVFLKNPQKQYKAFEIMHDMAPTLKVTDEAGDVIPWDPKTTNFNQFAQAFKDAKDQTWKGISEAVTHATGKDLHVDAGPILDFLNKTAGSKYTTSEVRAAAQRLSDEVANMAVPGTNGQIPIAGLTEYNKVLNTKISGVLTGTTDNAVRDLEAGLAKQLSEAADKAVESVSDGRFATLKDNYGALKTIEKDLVRRAQQESRQIDNSLGDFMNRYGTIEMANGFFQAAQGNFGPLAKGLGAKVIGAYSKKLRTPSTYLQKAFGEIDRFKSGEGIQNAAVKGVKAIKDMSKKSPRGMIDFNAEILPKKKVELPNRDTVGKFADKFTLPEKVPEGMQSRLKVLKSAIETSGKSLKDIYNNHKEAFNYLNDTGAFRTEKGLDETDIPKVIKAIYDVARAHKKAPLPKVSPATKMMQSRL